MKNRFGRGWPEPCGNAWKQPWTRAARCPWSPAAFAWSEEPVFTIACPIWLPRPGPNWTCPWDLPEP